MNRPGAHALSVNAGAPSSAGARIEVIGHRGAPREARENTIASFERALAHGVDGIELDVHGTADGVVVVNHDPVIGDETPSALAGRAIVELHSTELARAARDGVDVPPTLTDVLALVGHRAKVYVEIKGVGIEAAVVRCVQDSGTECAVHGFDHRVTRRVGILAPGMRTGILLEARLIDPVAALQAAGAVDLWQQWRMIDDDLVAAVHHAGGRVIAWTVNDMAAAVALIRMGVAGLCTDLPGELTAIARGHR